MERGYIKYWRKMDDWAWIDDKETFYVFVRMISFANWKDKAWQHVIVQRGSFITSRKKLAARLGVSVRQLRTIEKKLISSGEIEVKTTNKFTTYIIVKYEEYQSEEEKTTNKTSHERQASDKQVTTTKEGKELKKVKKKDISCSDDTNPKPLISTLEQYFELFWKSYPKKQARTVASKAFIKLSPTLETLNMMLESISRSKTTDAWLQDGGKFIPMPATWLNQRRWEDESSQQEVSASTKAQIQEDQFYDGE